MYLSTHCLIDSLKNKHRNLVISNNNKIKTKNKQKMTNRKIKLKFNNKNNKYNNLMCTRVRSKSCRMLITENLKNKIINMSLKKWGKVESSKLFIGAME